MNTQDNLYIGHMKRYLNGLMVDVEIYNQGLRSISEIKEITERKERLLLEQKAIVKSRIRIGETTLKKFVESH